MCRKASSATRTSDGGATRGPSTGRFTTRRELIDIRESPLGADRRTPWSGDGSVGIGGHTFDIVLGCVLAGALSAALTQAVYAAEDAFQHLPIHWMWWPAIGGLVIGVGGWMFPQALGVGYDVIGDLLRGDVGGRVILGVLIVKSVIWSVSLGSGTSGGVLAPLLMMGAALGAVEAWLLPAEGLGFWPLVSMGAILGPAERACAEPRCGTATRACTRRTHSAAFWGETPAGSTTWVTCRIDRSATAAESMQGDLNRRAGERGRLRPDRRD